MYVNVNVRNFQMCTFLQIFRIDIKYWSTQVDNHIHKDPSLIQCYTAQPRDHNLLFCFWTSLIWIYTPRQKTRTKLQYPEVLSIYLGCFYLQIRCIQQRNRSRRNKECFLFFFWPLQPVPLQFGRLEFSKPVLRFPFLLVVEILTSLFLLSILFLFPCFSFSFFSPQ